MRWKYTPPTIYDKVKKRFAIFPKKSYSIKLQKEGRLAQLVRAFALHAKCRGFESLIAHHTLFSLQSRHL